MLEKQHTNLKGIQKIINKRASMNWGLSDQLKKAFPETIPVIREEKVNKRLTLDDICNVACWARGIISLFQMMF